ncbi:MAG: ATP-binding protein, partial [Bacteroidota bacterium]
MEVQTVQVLTKTPELISRLQSFETFQDIPLHALEWLVEKSEYKLYPCGAKMFWAGMKVDHMQIIMDGRYQAWREQNGERRELGTWGTGYITGVLPFSRMINAKAEGMAIDNTYILELHRDYFTEMVNVCFTLTQALVGFMSNRIREFSTLQSQNEKLMALGKLSAGLAHELNNPASAIVRSAKELYQNVHQTPEKFKAVITARITPEQTDKVNAILFAKLNDPVGELSLLDRQDAIDDLTDWLDDHDIEDGDDLVETFVDYGLSPDELSEIEDIVEGESLPMILWWIESTLALEKLVNEIQESADRISELVSSVKEYSHMDRGSAMEYTDIRDGIKNTVLILKHKIKEKQIRINKEFDPNLPKFKAFVGELNQVWTNLIVNAIDAMDKGGTLTIKTYLKDKYICTSINDTGHGIPDGIKDEIFDTFFTTKSVSEGTGMGLDIT